MFRTTLSAHATEATTLTLRVENTGTSDARFCRYQTPFEGIKHPFIDVSGPDDD